MGSLPSLWGHKVLMKHIGTLPHPQRDTSLMCGHVTSVAAGGCCCCCWGDVAEPVSGALTDWFDSLAFGVSDSRGWECALAPVCWFQWIQWKQTGKAPAAQRSGYGISQLSTQTSDGSPLVHRPRCWCRTHLRGLGQLFTFVLGGPRCSSGPAGENRLPDRK